jgi:predicted metalloprotease with PDZ domain
MPASQRLPLALVCASFALGCAQTPAVAAPPKAAPPPASRMTVAVDATEAPRGLVHAKLSLPAHAGENVLAYPKWIPGEHGPTGPLVNVVGMRVSAGGKTLAWRRDTEHMYEVDVLVPPGAASVEVDLDVLSAPAGAFGASQWTTDKLMDLAWNQVVLYPKGARSSQVMVDASLKLPRGWTYATALVTAGEESGAVKFRPASLETLVDSPVIAGAYLKTIDLGTVRGVPHSISIVADGADALAAEPQTVEAWKRLVGEANALFGARHYDAYRFLVVASDNVQSYGLEHHQSSENHMNERVLVDEDLRRAFADLLSHEYVHSWNGKYRRPRGLATPTFQEPMRGDLLWVYEGLTEYLGWVLGARSGLETLEDAKQNLARFALNMDAPGRAWRPLVDTAIAAQTLYGAPGAGTSMRRSVDYYTEGLLIWLEADVLIRQKSNGARSLDDFCQRFHGGKDGSPEVRTYDLDEVTKTLNAVAPHDWKGFFVDRIYKVAPQVPLGGIEAAGYKLGYTAKKPDVIAAREKAFKYSTYWASLGFTLDEGGKIEDVLESGPAAKAGIAADSKLVAVDGRKFSPEAMKDALTRAKGGTAPIELLVEHDGFFTTAKVDFHGGERYRSVERDPGKPDLLAAILAPKLGPLPTPSK